MRGTFSVVIVDGFDFDSPPQIPVERSKGRHGRVELKLSNGTLSLVVYANICGRGGTELDSEGIAKVEVCYALDCGGRTPRAARAGRREFISLASNLSLTRLGLLCATPIKTYCENWTSCLSALMREILT